MDGAARSCPSCGEESPPRARFCMGCGQAFAEAETPEEARGERRQLTVMFCDMVGSSTLAGRLDPEEFRELVRAYQAACQKTIERYDGHVAQYLGDGLLVYFGYPQAHENDAERAVRSGLELFGELARLNERLEGTLGLRVSARVGVHSGPVVVGEMGSGKRRETLALGDTTNVAARLEGAAEPDTLVISEATLRLTGGLFPTRDLGELSLKGMAEPVRAHRVLQGPQATRDAVRHRAPLVGRERELERLRAGWRRAQEGKGVALRLCAEAGLGKSRLVQALRERIGEEAHTWLECRASPFGSSSPLQPVIDLVRQGLGFEEDDSSAQRLERLEDGLTAAGLRVDEALPVFAALLSLPLPEDGRHAPLQEGAELLRRRTFEALLQWLLALARQQPTVVVFEDLHWTDPSTLELLELLLEGLASEPVLALLTHRPEFEAPWLETTGGEALELGRLDPEEVRALVASAGGDGLSAGVLDRVVRRSDGVPLFAEELVRMILDEQSAVAEAAAAQMAVPATLQDSLMARLDRLGSAKPLAQLAATLGREFPHALLAAVFEGDEAALRRGLERLLHAELLEVEGVPPRARYTFHHALIQEVAYQSLLRSERRARHARIAEILETAFPERAEEAPEEVARHWQGAAEWRRAARGFDRAGRRSGERAAYAEAVAHYRSALEAIEHLPSSPERDRHELPLQILLGNTLMSARGYAAPEMLPVWERASQLAEEVADREELSSALNGVATFHLVSGDLERAASGAERILGIGTGHDVRVASLRGHCTLAQVLFYRGEPTPALEHAEASLALYRPGDFRTVTYGLGSDQGVLAHGFAGFALWWLGRADAALEQARAAVALAEGLGSPVSLAMGWLFEVALHYVRGEPEAGLGRADEMHALASRLRMPYWVGFGDLLGGVGETRLGEPDRGLERVGRGLAQLAQTGNQSGATFAFSMLAEAQLVAGRHVEAGATAGGGLALGEQLGQPYCEPELLRLQAEASLRGGDVDRAAARAGLDRAVEGARRRGHRALELRAATSLARLLGEDGHAAEARTLLEPLHAAFSEGLDTRDLREARSVLDALA